MKCPKCGGYDVEFHPIFTQDADSLPYPHCANCGFLLVKKK